MCLCLAYCSHQDCFHKAFWVYERGGHAYGSSALGCTSPASCRDRVVLSEVFRKGDELLLPRISLFSSSASVMYSVSVETPVKSWKFPEDMQENGSLVGSGRLARQNHKAASKWQTWGHPVSVSALLVRWLKKSVSARSLLC